MKILLVDFNDSFTLNIKQAIESIGHYVDVVDWQTFKDEVAQFCAMDYDYNILGPGPGHIHDYGLTDIFFDSLKDTNLIGICLGHQLLLESLDYELYPLDRPLHGKSISLESASSFFNSSEPIHVQFYNSWGVRPRRVTEVDTLELADMVIYFRNLKWQGVQFHPESVGTTCPKLVFRKLLSKEL